MAKYLRIAIFVGCFLYGGSAFAGTYYIAANGSDSNNGTSKTSPWLHAPGMPNCTGSCAAHTPAPGDQFIFRGGDTWHFGNSGASPYVGAPVACIGASETCSWLISWSGTNGNSIYWGVDQTWFSGTAWTRPIMNGDNPTSTSGVASCTYDESVDQLIAIHGLSGEAIFNTIDNFEFIGLCWSGPQQVPPGAASHINLAEFDNTIANHGNLVENIYIHGWTHKTFSCSSGPVGNCDGAFGIAGPSDTSLGHGDMLHNNVIDGSDTDTVSLIGTGWACSDVAYSVYRYLANGVVCNNNHTFHDNLTEYLTHSGDGQSHANGVEFNTEQHGTSNVFYNNVYRHFQLGGIGCGNVVVWRTPQTTDYAFNNLIYDQSSACNNANYWDLVTSNQGGADGWTDNEFNNTWILSSNGPFANSTMNGTSTVNMYNTHCITPNGGSSGSACQTITGKINYLTNVVQATSAATGQGYTAAELYAYSATASTNATVGAGTNQQGFCTTLLGSGDPALVAAGTACQSDTGYACVYNATTHSVSCPGRTRVARPAGTAWNVGAYQLPGLVVQPATSLQGTSH
jgi:hypothetical protein